MKKIGITRRQVSAILGKSPATVRRLEGTLLHPKRDALGVWRFSLSEVDKLRRRIVLGFRVSMHMKATTNTRTKARQRLARCPRCGSFVFVEKKRRKK